MPNDDIMTVKELADYLKIAEKTAYRFASEGRIRGSRSEVRGGFAKARSIAGSPSRNRTEDRNDRSAAT